MIITISEHPSPHIDIFSLWWELLRFILLETFEQFKYAIQLSIVSMPYIVSTIYLINWKSVLSYYLQPIFAILHPPLLATSNLFSSFVF